MNNYGMINFKFQLCCGPLTELTHKIVLVSTNLPRFLTWIVTLHQQVTKLIVKMKRHSETARPGAEAALQAGSDIHHITRYTPETSSRRTKIHHRLVLKSKQKVNSVRRNASECRGAFLTQLTRHPVIQILHQ